MLKNNTIIRLKDNWQDQLKNSLKTDSEIKDFFDIKEDIATKFTTLIPVSFAKKIKNAGKNSNLWKQFIPQKEENSTAAGFLDPIGDVKNAQGNGIIHRYKSRILYTPTAHCPVSCRYCFRKNELTQKNDIFRNNMSALKNYLHKNPGVNEVILTGGDPLMLNNNRLIQLFEMLSFAKIKFLRIHTRTPIILPTRINDGLVNLLTKFSTKFTKIIFVLHTNHADEIDGEVFKALEKLKPISIKKLTQSVLLKDINDSKKDLIQLFYRVLDCDFTPYYLHHPDQ